MQQYLKTYKTLEKMGCLWWEQPNVIRGSPKAKGEGENSHDGNWAYILSLLPGRKSGYKSYTFNKRLHVRLGLQKPLNVVGASLQLICNPDPILSRAPCSSRKLQLCLAAADIYRGINGNDHHIIGCVFLGFRSGKPLFIHSDEFIQVDSKAAHAGLRVLRSAYSTKMVGTYKTAYWKVLRILTRAAASHTPNK